MIASLALSASLFFTYPATYFHQHDVYLGSGYSYAEAQIAVDPTVIGTAYSDTQSGWLGIQQATSLVQVGWQRYQGVTREFVQVWGHGGITVDKWLPYSGSQSINVAIAYSEGEWNVYSEGSGTWQKVWQGFAPPSPKTGKWIVATESFDQNQPSPLIAGVGQGNGFFTPYIMGSF